MSLLGGEPRITELELIEGSGRHLAHCGGGVLVTIVDGPEGDIILEWIKAAMAREGVSLWNPQQARYEPLERYLD